jgi:peroxiredoxin
MTCNASAETSEDLFRRCRDMDGSLDERLQALAGGISRTNQPYSDALEQLVVRLRQTGAGRSAPRVGDLMPPFALPDDAGRLVSLSELCGSGPVAVTFHRGHWCPFCRISIHALVEAQRRLGGTSAHIVAIMPDRQQFVSELKVEADVPFPLLTDLDNGYAMSLNLAIWVGAEMERLIAAAGKDVPTYQGNHSWVLPIPATFVVGRNGRIRARFVDPDYRKRMAIDELLLALND